MLIGFKFAASACRDLQTKMKHEIQCPSFYLCHSDQLFPALLWCSLRPYLGFTLKIIKSEVKINIVVGHFI